MTESTEPSAYESIRQLAARYAVALDTRDLDTLVGLFVDDVQVGRNSFGRDALRAVWERELRAVGVTILNVGTHVIDFVDDDHATGIVYCHGEIQAGERWIRQAIVYRDTYERRAGSWYFVRRIHELFYGEEAATNPMQLPPANWPEHHDGRGTAPESFPTWPVFWARSPD
jgi:ketosteroid isomerase-like protein